MTAPLPTLVAIHGVPRSGTTWLGQIFNSSPQVQYRYQPLFGHAFRGFLTHDSSAADVARFIERLLITDDPFVHQKGEASLSGYELSFEKALPTHLVYKEVRFHDLLENLLRVQTDAVGIGVVRHPCAVLHSWINAPREFRSEWSLAEQWRHAPAKNSELRGNYYGFEAWKAVATMFQKLEAEHPRRFQIVRYEAVVKDPVPAVSQLFEAVGLDMSEQTLSFIAASRSASDGHPYGVLRGPTFDPNAWRDHLSDEIVEPVYRELRGTPLERYLD